MPRGAFLISIISILLMFGVSPVHAASTGKLKVSILGPAGVAVNVAMTKSSTRLVFSKAASLSSVAVTKTAATGTWKPGLSPVKSGSTFYVPTADKSSVVVSKGKTATTTITYRPAAVASNLKVSDVSMTSARVSFTKPADSTEVAVRVLAGNTAPGSVTAGTSVPVSGNSATATGLKANTTYTFGVFTKVGVFWVGPVAAATKTLTPADVDRLALLKIKYDNHPELFTKWTGTNHCAWERVVCNDGRVTQLDLDESGISILPAEIGNLTELSYLDISGNKLSSLPTEIGKLSKLGNLYAIDNKLTSVPASLGGLKGLYSLHLGDNQISSLPASIWGLTNLESLSLDGNNLASVPSEIGNLKKLDHLELSYNRLTSLPSSVWNLTGLYGLILHENQLTSVPSAISNLKKLEQLELGYNRLTSVPAEIGNLTNLSALGLSGNQLSTVPTSFGKLINLWALHLQDNNLVGDVSPWAEPLRKANKIYSFSMGGNRCLNAGGNVALETWLSSFTYEDSPNQNGEPIGAIGNPDWRDGC